MTAQNKSEPPTIAAQSSANAASGRSAAPAPPLVPGTRDLPLLPSFAQQRLWFLDQWDPGNPVYILPLAIRMAGPLDVAALRRSLDGIAQRHEPLRTTFAERDGQPTLTIAGRGAIALAVVELGALPADHEQTAASVARAAARHRFDLARGPLARATLLRLAADDHLLVVALHRIIADESSLDVFVDELATLYAADRAGRRAALPALPLQHADFASWQRRWLQDDHAESPLQTQLAYWRRSLAGASTALELPTDRPRPPSRSFQGALHTFTLPAQPVAALDKLCRRHDTPLFAALLAMFSVLLHRYTGQTDLLIGAPVAGRTHSALAPLIGLFENTLVLRADLSGRPSFDEVARRMREVWLEAQAHQDLPFELLVDELRPERDLSRAPLFQAMLAQRQSRPRPVELDGLTLTPVVIDSGIANFDLALFLEQTGPELRATLEYNTDLFEAATIGRLAGHLQTLLDGIAADPRRSIATLALLTAGEQRQLLIDWNDTARPYPHEAGLQHLLDAQAERAPDAVALTYGAQQLTYAALHRRANQLAWHLRRLGIGPDALVGLLAERSVEMIVGILGILKAGGAYVPLDPAYPAERIALMLKDSQAQVLITTKDEGRMTNVDALSFVVRRSSFVNLGADWPAIAAQPQGSPPHTTLDDQRAYVIYTSGSTGRPKGVMVRRRGLLNLSYGLRAFFDQPAMQHIGLITSISFDISVNQIFPTLLFGRTLHIVPDEVKLDSPAFVRFVQDRQIQLIDGVPSFFQSVLADIAPQRPATALRYLLIGGEKLEPPLLEAVFTQLGDGVVIVNIYGLTEITDINAFAVIRAADLGQPITVGMPLQNNRIYLTNRAAALQPVGVVGEVCVAGESLSRGYLNRPDLTAEKFVPCPFETGALMCRTGDLGRRRPDGTITILGRIDHQVKLRGYRIELGEIEAALLQHAGVREGVVVAQAEAAGESRLVAYVVPASDEGPTTNDERRMTNEGSDSSFVARPSSFVEQVRSFLKARLPGYMLPSAFVLLDALPRTPNGKVDRRALPTPQDQPNASDQVYVAPRTPIEHVLADMWRDALQLVRVGIDDNLFDLGGHSLSATRIVSRIRQAFQINLTVRHLFETPTVAALAAQMVAAETQPGRTDKIARALQRLQNLSAADRQRLLQQKQEREES